jgi:malonate-semialdehyde dehydrogenase (acetylating)/methylmalonate-semialdehyde dehydrogenase
MTDANDVASAISAAFPGWRGTPVQTRVQYLFTFKQLLEKNADHMAGLTTRENGKTLAGAQGELRRGVENVEVACGMPTMTQK